MSTKPNDGGQAFPCKGAPRFGTGADAERGLPYDQTPLHLGMTLRDYFAGQINAAIIVQNSLSCAGLSVPFDGQRAEISYAAADAMLVEKIKTE